MDWKRKGVLALAAGCGVCLVFAQRARGQSTWIGGSGNWSNPADWSPAGVPGNGEEVDIFDADGVARTVTLDVNSADLAGLTVDLTGNTKTSVETDTLSMVTTTLTISGEETIGNNGSGAVVQSGGLNTTTDLSVAEFTGSMGNYSLGGTGMLSATDQQFTAESVGSSGAGFFNQSGGTNNAGAVYLGVNSGGTGTYTLSESGSLTATDEQFVSEIAGDSGIGYFSQSGGTNTTSQVELGFNSGSTGTYLLAGNGTLTATNQQFVSEIVGVSGTGYFFQTGGSNTASEFEVGFNAGSTGTYSLSGSGVLSASNAQFVSEIVGNSGTGYFIQSGGANSTPDLDVGANSGGKGTYVLSAGSLSVTGGVFVGGDISGARGRGNVNIMGGQATVGGTLQIFGTAGTGLVMSAGSLSAGNTVNSGMIGVTGGMASLGIVSGTGSLFVGGSGAVVASGMQQSSVAIGTNGSVQITAGGAGNVVGSLSITGNGALDLTSTELTINYGSGPDPVATIRGYLQNGCAGGSWTGSGIDSSVAAVSAGVDGVGYADAADPGNPAGLASGTIESVFTLLGDADLNGVVNGVDFGILAANFNKGVSAWDEGDFNYDNVVNGLDFAELARNFNQSVVGQTIGPGAMSDPAIVAFAEENGLMSDLPESAGFSILGIGLVGMMARRAPREKHPRRRRGRWGIYCCDVNS